MKHTVKKADAINLCKEIANDYDDWEFTAGNFKNKRFKHTDIILDLGLSVSSGAGSIEPSTEVLNKKIKLLDKKIVHEKPLTYTSFIRHASFEESYDFNTERFYTLDDGKAEKVIRHALDVSIEILEKHYNYTDEHEFLENLPVMVDGPLAIQYCLVRAYLGDLDYVRDYKLEKIESIRPKRHADIDKVIDYFDIAM
ncbi:MAG: hypothetical protein V7765_19580 [Oleispira sp.]